MPAVAVSKEEFLDVVRESATNAANDLADAIRRLPREEQIPVVEAILTVIAKHLNRQDPMDFDKGYPEFDPGQQRDQSGQWSVSGVAGATASAAGRAAAAGAGAVLSGMREALSKVTLIPSSKTNVREAITNWWERFKNDNNDGLPNQHMEATVELAGRIFITFWLGVAAVVLVHAFIGAAGTAVGAAVGRVLAPFVRGA